MFCGPESSWCRIGSRKAAVLPVPVWAVAMRSRPARMARDRFGLHRRRFDVTHVADGLHQGGVKTQFAEWHQELPGAAV